MIKRGKIKSISGNIAKSDQEQAVSSWINYLNQVRLNQLLEALQIQDGNLNDAVEILDSTLKVINEDIIEHNRGGFKGMHGFIAEVAECGVTNARRVVEGKAPNCIWINDNGPTDIIRDGVNIQQKFVANGNHLSLEAIRKHYDTYPWYLDKVGKYQIPKDHYEKIKHLLSVTPEQANKMPTSNGEFSLKQWKEVQEFFNNSEIKLSDIEPSKLDYKAVQAGEIKSTLSDEKTLLKDTDSRIRKEAYDRSKPTVEQEIQVAAVSAAVEGTFTFCSEIIKKRRSGKQIKEFTSDDWNEVLKNTGLNTGKGAIRGISVYKLTNFTATPASVANGIVTASFGVAEQANLLRQGKISGDQFILNSEILCLDVSVSALSSLVGQIAIPVPVLGAIIGNTLGSFVYQITKDNLSRKEESLVAEHLEYLKELDSSLENNYKEFVKNISSEMIVFYEMLDRAFSPNIVEAFDASIALAEQCGVKDPLRTISDIDEFFLG